LLFTVAEDNGNFKITYKSTGYQASGYPKITAYGGTLARTTVAAGVDDYAFGENQATSGVTSITLTGLNFGYYDPSPTSLFGSTTCISESWVSTSLIRCGASPGTGIDPGHLGYVPKVNIAVSVAAYVGCLTAAFTFDAPVVSATITGGNQPPSAGASVTLSGLSFGHYMDWTPTIGIGSHDAFPRICNTATWTSGTTVVCFANLYGHGNDKIHTTVEVSNLLGTYPYSFTYDAPVVSYNVQPNSATCEGSSISVNGLNFGMSDTTATTRLGFTVCTSTSWLASTTLRCLSAPGASVHGEAGGDMNMLTNTVTISLSVGTLLDVFTYDAPMITRVFEENGPVTTGNMLTVNGLDFGSGESCTPTVNLGYSLCDTTSWSSHTTVGCFLHSGRGLSHPMVITVATLMATLEEFFTFDAPTTSYIMMYNGPPSGRASVTVTGQNFGIRGVTPSMQILWTSCITTSWTSTSSLRCTSMRGGSGRDQQIGVTVATHVGTLIYAFTYDSPVISHWSKRNLPTSGGLGVTLYGQNFGHTVYPGFPAHPPTAAIVTHLPLNNMAEDQFDCTFTHWVSTTQVQCQTQSGDGRLQSYSVTLQNVVGTKTHTFTFDSPVLSGIHNFNGPATGKSSLTILGLNFASTDRTQTGQLNTIFCVTTAWSSSTSLACHDIVDSQHTGNPFVTVVSLVSTGYSYFTFDAPVMSKHTPHNMPRTGGISVTFRGTRFSAADETPSIRLSSFQCVTSSWTSISAMTCYTARGSLQLGQSDVTISTLIGTLVGLFTFDQPVVTELGPENGPLSGASSITVSGLQFGTRDLTVSVGMGQSYCLTASWSSDTALQCRLYDSAHWGIKKFSNVYSWIDPINLSSSTGTKLHAWTFDAPVISNVVRRNAPSSGGLWINYIGQNFSPIDLSPTARRGFVCHTTAWTSATQIQCLANDGDHNHLTGRAKITMESLVGTALYIFTFDAPVVSMVNKNNGPTSGDTYVTVTGLNFGTAAVCPTIRMGWTDCDTSTWTSNTFVRCVMPHGTGILLDNRVTISTVIGTQNIAFTYDAIVMSHFLATNGPTSGATTLTVQGENFAFLNPTPTIHLAKTLCATMAWTTGTTVLCRSSPGDGEDRKLTITIHDAKEEQLNLWNYDAPVTTFIDTPNTPTCFGATVTMSGLNFGIVDPTPTQNLGNTYCATSSWFSKTVILCRPSLGTSNTLVAKLIINDIERTRSFTYDAPTVTYAGVKNIVVGATYAVMTIQGINFGGSDATPSAELQDGHWNRVHPVPGIFIPDGIGGSGRWGSIPCKTVSWSSTSSVACRPRAAFGVDISTVVDVSTTIGTLFLTFTYDAPVVDYTISYKPWTAGNKPLFVRGKNFGGYDTTPTVRIGDTLCATTIWTSDVLLTCLHPPGSGVAHTVVSTVASILGTMVAAYTYDSPRLTAVHRWNAAHTGGVSVTLAGASITLHGYNFGSLNLTPTAATFSVTFCRTTAWTSTTSLKCATPPGGAAQNNHFPIGTTATVATIVGTMVGIFTYDSPVASFGARYNWPTSGATSVTVSGVNYGTSDPSVSVVIANMNLCASSSWMSSTSLTCANDEATYNTRRLAVTVAKLIGTMVNIFTFDAAVATNLAPVNAPISGGASITVQGFNFMSKNTTPTVRIGNPICTTLAWTSVTAVYCDLYPNSGSGPLITTGLTMSSMSGTYIKSFTFDSPVVSSLLRANHPVMGWSSITIYGNNFGQVQFTPTAVVGLSEIMDVIGITITQQTVWQTDTSMKALSASGSGIFVGFMATVTALVGTATNFFSYNAPVMTHGEKPNFPFSGGNFMTVQGVNFGVQDLTPTIALARTSCGSTTWTSTTAVLCVRMRGDSLANVVMTLSSHVGTMAAVFSFDAPILSFSLQTNTPHTGAGIMTLSGMNYGGVDPTPTIDVHGDICISTSWSTSTVMKCITPPQSRMRRTVGVTIATFQGTTLKLFSYDGSVITLSNPINAAGTAGTSITLLGINFADIDPTPSALLRSAYCQTISWSTSTSIRCSPTNGPSGASMVTVAAQVGTTYVIFTFDSPVLSRIPTYNTPTAHGYYWSAYLTIQGINFAKTQSSPTVNIGHSMCRTTAFTSDTHIVCEQPRGAGVRRHLSVTIAAIVGTRDLYFTYDAPVASQMEKPNNPSTGTTLITVYGNNFGGVNLTPSGRVLSIECGTTTWSSTTTVRCKQIYHSIRYTASTHITVNTIIGTGLALFTYDTPVISSVTAAQNSVKTGASVLTFDGLNFGNYDYTPSSYLDELSCTTAAWSSSTTVTCEASTTPYGTSYRASLTVMAVVGTSIDTFTYDAPTVSFLQSDSLHGINLPPSMGKSLTLTGFNFGPSDTTPTQKLGVSTCRSTTWTSDTTVTCDLESASGIRFPNGHTLVITVSKIIGTLHQWFTYDSPVHSFLKTFNAPASGGLSVTVHGANFGYDDSTVTIQIGVTNCRTVGWTSGTSVACRSYAELTTMDVSVKATVATLVGTAYLAFTYDAPIISRLDPKNLPPSAMHSIMIDGTHFGSENLTPTISIGHFASTQCQTTGWSSVTSVRCLVSEGDGYISTATITMSTMVGTRSESFTYDSPVVTFTLPLNSPTSVGGSMTVSGINFSVVNPTVTAQIGYTMCPTTSWTTQTSIKCEPAVGETHSHSVPVTVAARISTFYKSFTYDAPIISFMNPKNGVIDLGTSLTITGMNIGVPDLTSTARIGYTTCATSAFVSDTSLLCHVPYGVDDMRVLAITSSDIVGFVHDQATPFTYDGPVITWLKGSHNAPTLPGGFGKSITVVGAHFGPFDLTPAAFVHYTLCGTSSWTSVTSVTCRTPLGIGDMRSAVLSISSVIGTLVHAFTYDLPVITYVDPYYGSGLGGTHVTVSGINLGAVASDVMLSVGSTECQAVSVITDHLQLGCLTPPGAGTGYAVSITANSLYNSKLNSYSYTDIIIVENLTPLSGSPMGGTWITLNGQNFGTDESVVTVTVGGRSCTNLTLVSDGKVVAMTPAGEGAYQPVKLIREAYGIKNRGGGVSFSYLAPRVLSINPSSGRIGAGDTITIKGDNFGLDVAKVNLIADNTTACPIVKQHDNTTILCTLTYSVPGLRSVVVKVGDQIDATKYNEDKVNATTGVVIQEAEPSYAQCTHTSFFTECVTCVEDKCQQWQLSPTGNNRKLGGLTYAYCTRLAHITCSNLE
jgi:hypothetical protein